MEVQSVGVSKASQAQHNPMKQDISNKKPFIMPLANKNMNVTAKDTIDKMLNDIQEIKDKVDFELTVENVMKYKDVIKSFLQFYSDNVLEAKTISSRGQFGHRETHTIVKKVEEGVKELDDTMGLLDTRSGHLDTLKKIGEINGLILNLRL